MKEQPPMQQQNISTDRVPNNVRHGALAVVIPVLAFAVLSFLFVLGVLAFGNLLRPITTARLEVPMRPPTGPLVEGGISTGLGLTCLGAAIVAASLIIALAIVGCCCCCKGRADLDIAVIIRQAMEPLYTALKIIGAAVTTIGETVVALSSMMDALLAALKNLPQPPSDPGTQSPFTVVGNAMQDGVDAMRNTGTQTINTGRSIVESLPKPP